ncbi:hypothetical protein D7024_14330 [Desulfofundulus salinus]|uniref:Uncharacterized protein n=1 Tax=Desulfofundulus salinus TaxID=2419843 RepID=A0A494X5D8_9FIRM|nr:hypothetical protein D7024_14330 [Desulfofundulus salinum]
MVMILEKGNMTGRNPGTSKTWVKQPMCRRSNTQLYVSESISCSTVRYFAKKEANFDACAGTEALYEEAES